MSKIKQGYKQTKVGIIPEDWEVVKLSEIFSKSFYGTSDSTNEIGKYPVLRMGNITMEGKIIYNNLKYLDCIHIKSKELYLAIPAKTSKEQLKAIDKSIEYARSKGTNIIVNKGIIHWLIPADPSFCFKARWVGLLDTI